jgi:hypothetical protein
MQMDDRTVRLALERHWNASDANDFDTEHEIYREDAILNYPQSGERIRGRRNIQESRFVQPNKKRFTVRRIRKGERGTTVVYADRFVPKDEKRRAHEDGDEAQAIPFLKRFTVFNTDQCADLPAEIATAAPPPPPGLIEPTVEALIKATGITFHIGGDRAFYAPAEDYVRVPPPQAYFEPINWHRTALHELGHNAEPRIMPREPRFPRETQPDQ